MSGTRFAGRVPLGRAPSLHRLRRRARGVVRRLRRYYGPVRLPALVHPRLTASAFPERPAQRSTGRASSGISRFSRMKDSVHAQVLRPRGVHRTARANAAGSVAFRLVRRRRHPEAVISRLNSWPACTPVNASLRPRGSPTHDSGPPWIATPSMSGVLIPFLHAGLSRRFPHVPCTEAADRAHVAYMPDTAWPETADTRQTHPGLTYYTPVLMPPY